MNKPGSFKRVFEPLVFIRMVSFAAFCALALSKAFFVFLVPLIAKAI